MALPKKVDWVEKSPEKENVKQIIKQIMVGRGSGEEWGWQTIDHVEEMANLKSVRIVAREGEGHERIRLNFERPVHKNWSENSEEPAPKVTIHELGWLDSGEKVVRGELFLDPAKLLLIDFISRSFGWRGCCQSDSIRVRWSRSRSLWVWGSLA